MISYASVEARTDLSAEMKYIEHTANYLAIKSNTLPVPNTIDPTYVYMLRNSSIPIFQQIAEMYYSGKNDYANSLNAGITPTNAVESNYQTFFNLYHKFLTDTILSRSDSTSLWNLAHLCPGTNGAVIYRARAMYNNLYKTIVLYTNTCGTGGAVGGRQGTGSGIDGGLTNQKIVSLQIDLYPNPANNFVTLVGKEASDNFTVTICDVNGKIVMNENVKTNIYTANMALDLKNGIYFVTITNQNNERTIKKLVIAK